MPKRKTSPAKPKGGRKTRVVGKRRRVRKTPVEPRETTRPICVSGFMAKGNLDYVRLVRACCTAILNGETKIASFTAEDEDGDEMATTVQCADLKVLGTRRPIGFRKDDDGRCDDPNCQECRG